MIKNIGKFSKYSKTKTSIIEVAKYVGVDEDGNVYDTRGDEPILLKPYVNKGYLAICSWPFNHISISINVHRIIAYIKYGELALQHGLETRHKNNYKLDNSWDNIVLGTHTDNMQDIPQDIRIQHMGAGLRNYFKNMSEEDKRALHIKLSDRVKKQRERELDRTYPTNHCIDCGTIIGYHALRCHRCHNKHIWYDKRSNQAIQAINNE